jgi:hypothetical protein
MGRIWERRKIRTLFWWANVKEGVSLVETGVRGRIILSWILNKQERKA